MKSLKIAIIAAILFLGASIAWSVSPVLEFDNQLENYKVILTDKPCVDPKVTAIILPQFLKHFHAGTIIWQGDPLSLCWAFTKALNPDGPEDPSKNPTIFLVDETGDMGFMSYLLFAKPDYI